MARASVQVSKFDLHAVSNGSSAVPVLASRIGAVVDGGNSSAAQQAPNVAGTKTDSHCIERHAGWASRPWANTDVAPSGGGHTTTRGWQMGDAAVVRFDELLFDMRDSLTVSDAVDGEIVSADRDTFDTDIVDDPLLGRVHVPVPVADPVRVADGIGGGVTVNVTVGLDVVDVDDDVVTVHVSDGDIMKVGVDVVLHVALFDVWVGCNRLDTVMEADVADIVEVVCRVRDADCVMHTSLSTATGSWYSRPKQQ